MQNSRWWNGILGGVSGLALVSGVCQFWLNAGTSLPAQSALAVSVFVAFLVNAAISARVGFGLAVHSIRVFVLSAWPVALPSLFGVSWRLIEGSGFDISSSVPGQCAGLSLLALVTQGVPVACSLGLIGPERQTSFGVAFATMFAIGGLGLATLIGPDGCGLLSSVCGLIAFVALLVRGTQSVGHVSNVPASAKPSLNGHVGNVPRVVGLIATGIAWVIGQRLCRQFIPDSFALMTFELSVLVGGIAVGGLLFGKAQPRHLLVRGLGLASWMWLLFAAFPLGVRLALWENSTISQVWLLQTLRMTMVGAVLGPIAMSIGALLRSAGSIAGVAASLTSATLAMWLLPSIGIWNLALTVSGLLLVVVADSLRRIGHLSRIGLASGSTVTKEPDASAFRLKSLGTAVAAVMLLFTLTAPAWVRYQPSLAAKVLFDTGVFVASRAETPWEQLPMLDEGRATFVREGDRGTLSAWKFSGSRFLVRENGIPKGTLAGHSSLAPRFLPDVLPIVLPLVVHERPQNLLLLGQRAGEPLAAATMFPLQRIVSIEADRGVDAMCRTLLSRGSSPSPMQDDRLAIRLCDPALAIRTMGEKFDVIIASADQPSLPQSANLFTVESLQATARRLNEEGLFAIRFQHVDLGPRSVRGLAATMSVAFREVAAIEIAPGELLFLGTQSERGFVREGFVERLQRSHVRRLLASTGWDWCALLRLSMLNHEAIQELASQPGGVANVASRSTWPFRLPAEVMRWDNKLEQVQSELGKHSRFLLAWGGDASDDLDVAARLSEWELSRAIIRRHPDEFWAYRKQVKEHMTGSPRAMIQQVSHLKTESGLHPDDDRRLRYFKTIGELAKNPQLTEADLDRLRCFESPFDPLVTPFLHQEVVELTTRGRDRNSAAELHHRLAAIYFSTPADRSVRNVTEALQFVNSTPSAISDPSERFDHLNALLQTLLARWTARGEFRPTSSRVALNDIEQSIAAAELSFTTLDSLSADGVVPAAEWNARKQHLERRLVRPLRTYRSQVMQHYVKNERTNAAVESLPATGDASSND